MKVGSSPRNAAVDLMKGLAILGVIINHSGTASQRASTLAALTVMQAVPVFIILMGYNAKCSLDRKQASTGRTYPRGYLWSRVWRLLAPVTVAVLVSIAVALQLDREIYIGYWTLLLVKLPVSMRGQYFIAIALWFAVLAPLLVAAYRRHPRGTLWLSVALAALFELVAPFKHDPGTYFLYQTIPLRFLALFVLGLWLAEKPRLTRASWIGIGTAAAVSAVYLVARSQGLSPDFSGPEYMYEIFAAGWPLMMAAVGLAFLTSHAEALPIRALALLGQASYHIFLVQGLWFIVVNARGRVEWVLLGILACSAVGVLWYSLPKACPWRRRPTVDRAKA